MSPAMPGENISLTRPIPHDLCKKVLMHAVFSLLCSPVHLKNINHLQI